MTHVPHRIPFEHRDRLRDEWRREHIDPLAIWRRAGLAEGMAAADIGVGIGYFALPAADLVGAAGKIFAADVSPDMLDALASAIPAHLTGRITLLTSGEHEIPLPDEVADVAMLAFVAHEVAEPARLIRECARILKPGGRLSLLDWDPVVPPPPGPPAEARLAQDAVREAIRAASLRCELENSTAPGVYELVSRKI